MDTQIAGITLRVIEGDICDQVVDAIVNAASNALWMGGGVAGAIKRRGGDEIEREAMAKGPVAVGEAVTTSGGKLAAKYVIHAAVMGQDLRTDAGKIRAATSSALAAARGLGLASIAFPALGTGVGGFPLEQCAQMMKQAILDHAAAGTTLSTIELVLFGRDAHAAFSRVFGG